MSVSAKRRVVITGLGVISPLGNEIEQFWTALVEGRSGVRRFASVPTDFLPTTVAAEAWDFSGHIDDFGQLDGDRKKAIRKALKVMCRETQMAVAAAQRAVADSALAGQSPDPERSGCVFGSDYMMTMPQEFIDGIRKCADENGQFDYSKWGTEGLGQMTPLWMLKYLPNMPGSHIAIFNDFRGPSNSLTHREAASNLAVGEAFHTILRGSADRMIAGATGTRVHPMKVVHAAQTEQLAPGEEDPARSSRPFDKNRRGMVLGEGAGAVVLEELESALARGATIYAEVVGAGSSAVADKNLQARREIALANAMKAALRDAGATPEEIGHVNAHGLGSLSSDADEAQALHTVFGERAGKIPLVAPKSFFGNLGAGGGVVELAASALALRHGHLFPVLNYETPDPDCPVAAVRSADVGAGTSCLNLSITPQGQAAVVMLRKWAA
jgi:3-oxoacyl-[acyl-carrier-protein] synthase II